MIKDNKVSKVFILAGGVGSRLAEQTKVMPKPLVQVGPDPVILHVMRRYYYAGVKDFYLLCGYKIGEFKHFFQDYMLNGSNMLYTRYGFQPIDDSSAVEDWHVNIINTGETSSTGQRINYIRNYLDKGEPFFLTYGDSVSNVDVLQIEKQHFGQPRENLVTITAINRTERFGIIKTNGDNIVESFSEKSDNDDELINGGYMTCNYDILKEVNENSGDFSHETLRKIAAEGKMSYYHHKGFWHAMDTQKDVDNLNKLYKESPELFKE